MPKLSVITINYNNSSGLNQTINSVLNQTFKDYEYIVIDGGSTDGSKELIKQFENKISYWVSEKDNGIYNAMNKGIKQATGEYCLFLNSGDKLVDNLVLEKVFEKKYTNGIIYGNLITVDENGNQKYRKSSEYIGKIKMLADTLWHPVSFIKRELFLKYGDYDERFKMVADYEFFVRVIIAKKVSLKHISLDIAAFDTSGLSSDLTKRKELEAERKQVQDKYFNPLLLKAFRLYSKLRN